jgi:uncharacterized protein YjdB
MAVYKQIKRVSDLETLSKVVSDAQVLLAINKKNWRTSLSNIDQQKIVKIEQDLSTEDGKISSINLTMKDGSIVRLAVANGSTGDKGKTGKTGERGDKGDSAIINTDRSKNFVMIVNDCDTDDSKKVLSAAQGVIMNESIDKLSETFMSDEKYQLLFRSPIFIDAEFVSMTDDEDVLLFNADPADHTLYVKYWTYESDGSTEYFVYNDFAKTYDSINADLWDDIYLGNTTGYFIATTAQLTDGNTLYVLNRKDDTYTQVEYDDAGNKVFNYFLKDALCDVSVFYDNQTKLYDYSLIAEELKLNVYQQVSAGEYVRIPTKDKLDLSGFTLYYEYTDGEYVLIPNINKYIEKKPLRFYKKENELWVEIESFNDIKVDSFEEYIEVSYDKVTNTNTFRHFVPVSTIFETYYETYTGILTNYSLSYYIYDELREYFTRKLVEKASGTWEYEYSKINIPFWVDAEYITDSEDQTILLLYSDKEQSEVETIKPVYIDSIEFESSNIDIRKNSCMDLSVNIYPSTVNVTDMILDYDETIMRIYEDGRIAAINSDETTLNTSLTLRSANNPNISDTIDIRVVTPIDTINLSEKSIELYPGNTKQINYTTVPEIVTNNNVVWSTSDNEMIKVSETGLVELVQNSEGGYKTGMCKLICTACDGFGAKTEINVLVAIPVTSIEIKSKNFGFIGFEKTLDAIVYPEDATQPILKYSSSNPDIINIDENTGKYTPISEGKCILTATTTDGTNISKSIEINVTTGVNKINITGIDEKLDIGLTNEFEIELLPEDIDNNLIEFNVSDESIIDYVTPTLVEGTNNIYRGSITAKSGGFTTISVIAGDGTETFNSHELFVTIPISDVEFEQKHLTMYVNDVLTLQPLIGPSDATNINEKLIWKSSNPYIVSVDDAGRVQGKLAGIAVVSAMVKESSSVLASCVITVKTKCESIILNGGKESMTILLNNVDFINAEVTPSNATDQLLKWLSSDSSIVSVQENGIITGESIGTAIISAISTDGSNVTNTISVQVVEEIELVTEPVTEPTEPSTEETTEPTTEPTTDEINE